MVIMTSGNYIKNVGVLRPVNTQRCGNVNVATTPQRRHQAWAEQKKQGVTSGETFQETGSLCNTDGSWFDARYPQTNFGPITVNRPSSAVTTTKSTCAKLTTIKQGEKNMSDKIIWTVEGYTSGKVYAICSSKAKAIAEIDLWKTGLDPYEIETDIAKIKVMNVQVETITIVYKISGKRKMLYVNKHHLNNGAGIIHAHNDED